MDQGGEFYNNPKVKSLFEKYKYELFPTGTDSSSQNGPIKQVHCTASSVIKSCLIGTSHPISYWPFAIHLSTGRKDNLTNLIANGGELIKIDWSKAIKQINQTNPEL